MIENLFSAPLAILPGYVEQSILPRAENRALYESSRAEFLLRPERRAEHREALPGGAEMQAAAAGGEWLINRENRRAWISYNMDSVTRIGQINAVGTIGKGLDAFDIMYFGGCCVDQMQTAMEHLAEYRPRAVALHFGSPGGTTSGVQEMTEYIAGYSEAVAPVHAYTDTMCASAAYWLAMGADSFTAAPTALIGCIGTLCLVRDSSEAAAQAGVKVHRLASGWAKGQGMPGVPVDPEYLAFLQRGVDANAERFFATVAGRRGPAIEAQAREDGEDAAELAGEMMQGQYWEAQDAPRALVDGLLPSRAAHVRALHAALTSRR